MRITPEIKRMIKVVQAWVENYGQIWSRKVLYELVSHQLIKDTADVSYQKVCRTFKNLRQEGLVPYDWFRDKKTTEENVGIPKDESFDDWFKWLKENYKKSSNIYQENYVEVWTEKELPDPAKILLEKYEVGLLTSEGFVGDVAQHHALERLCEINQDKPVTILYITDYDCEGEHIYNLIAERYKQHDIFIEKLAMKKEQVKELGLISNIGYRQRMLKKKKTVKYHLSKDYVRRFFERNTDLEPDGIVQYELDAYPVPALLEILEKAISSLIDIDLINGVKERNKEEVQEWMEKHYRR